MVWCGLHSHIFNPLQCIFGKIVAIVASLCVVSEIFELFKPSLKMTATAVYGRAESRNL